MANISSILSILVDANTGSATTKLSQFDRQLAATRSKARQAVEAKLGANFDSSAFTKYEEQLSKAQRRVSNKAAFKAALGGDFNASAFRAYDKAINQAQTQHGRMTKTVKDNNSSMGRSFGSLVGGVLAATGAFAFYNQAKGAVAATTDLTLSTAKLSAITGMDAKTASTWIEVMKARGMQVSMAQMGFVTLARNVANAEKGSKASSDAFKRLGISMATLKSGDTNKIILQAADGFTKIRSPLDRAAIAQTIFGRNARSMIPLLAKGSQGIKEQLAIAQSYGAYIGGDANSKLQSYKDSLFQFRYALDGLKITFTEAVLPYLALAMTYIEKFIQQIRDGTGIGGQFASAVSTAFGMVKDAVGGVIHMAGGVHNFLTALEALLAVFIAFKVVSGIMAAAQLAMNPMLWIAVALAAAAYLIIKNWKTIGPFLKALWASIRADAQVVVQWLTNAWANTAGAVTGAWRATLNWLTAAWNQIRSTAAPVILWLITAWATVAHAMSSLFGPVISAIVSGIQSLGPAIGPALAVVRDVFTVAFAAILPILELFVSAIRPIIAIVGVGLSTAFQVASIVIRTAMSVMGTVVSAGWTVIKAAFEAGYKILQSIMGAIAGVIRGAFQVIRGVLEVFAGVFTLNFSKMWQGIKDIFGGALGAIVAIIKGYAGIMTAAGKFIITALSAGISAAWAALKTMFSGAVQVIVTTVKGIWNAMYTAGKFIITGVGQGIESAINGVLKTIWRFVGAIVKVINHIPGVSIDIGAAPQLAKGGLVAAGVQKFATGGLVKAPGYFAGEEGPAHPEIILATNPAYRSRNLKLFGMAGQMLGVPGFAQGGVFGYLKSLWLGAGGAPPMAQLMAAIAMAESGGNQYAHNPSGASGYWQILGQIVPGNIYDPHVNAENAVAKLASQGLGAWAAYTNGAYKQYLGGDAGGGVFGAIGKALGGAAGALGGALGDLVSAAEGGIKGILAVLPKPPDLPDWISGLPGHLLSKAAHFIEDKVGGFFGFQGGHGSVASVGGSPAGVGSYQGVQVANWVIAALQYAAAKGVQFQITSGYRPGQDPHTATGASEHQGTVYPHGAVDFGGYHDAHALMEKMQVVYATRDFKWPLLAPAGFVDDGHASGTGHQRGGVWGALGRFAGAFGTGGMVSAAGPTLALFGERGPETAVFIPGFAGGGLSSAGGSISSVADALSPKSIIGQALAGHPAWRSPGGNTGGGGGGGSAGGGLASGWQGALLGMPAMPVLAGAAPRTAAGADSIVSRIGGLRTTLSTLQHKYSAIDSFYSLSSIDLLDPVTGARNEAGISERVNQLDRLAAIARQIFDTFQSIVAWTRRLVQAYRNLVSDLKAKQKNAENLLASLHHQLAAIHTTGLTGNALTSARKHQSDLKAQITKTEKVRTSAIADIATYSGKVTDVTGQVASASDDRDSAWLDVLRVQGERTAALATKAQPSTAAPSSVSDAVAATGTDTQTGTQAQLLQTLYTQSQQALAVSQAQYKVLQNFPRYLGRAQAGGLVTVGEAGPELVSLPGGASIYPNGAYTNATRPVQVEVVILDGAVDPNKIQVIAEGAAVKVTRGQARAGDMAGRLPGARGGL